MAGIFVAANVGCIAVDTEKTTFQDCTDEWFQFIEEKISTGDEQGHGPDLGSLEWRSVVEFKLGIRGYPEIPPLESNQWCNYINAIVVGNAA